MWRWTVLLYLLIFFRYSSSQPIIEDNENVREARQLDFGECCPCTGTGKTEQRDFAAQEFMGPPGEGTSGRARDLDDCPCKPQQSDSEGASSIFFPTAMRADGPVVRPNEKKEDLRPLLHPEVDLASSVLQTLREATDEEYQDALARDAARSIAKAAEETVFGDATPEASTRNIVTIIVSPKQTEIEDDVIPQESHIQESRCIHSPQLERVRTDPGKMRVTSKPANLLHEIFESPKLSKPTQLLHRNLWDMDSSVGASKIQENAIPVDDGQVNNGNIQGFKKYTPLMKLDTNMKSFEKSPNGKGINDDDCSDTKVSHFKPSSIQNKLKDLISSSPPLEDLSNIRSLSLIPKIRLDNSWLKAKGKDTEDLSISPSNFQEQATGKKSYFRPKSYLEGILERTRPLDLKNFLKLKDVEFIPLKELVGKASERDKFNKPKFILPATLNKEDVAISTYKNQNDPAIEARDMELIEILPHNKKYDIFEPEVSPSSIVEKISDDNCEGRAIEANAESGVENNEDETSTERFDIVPSSSSGSQLVVNDKSTISQSEEFTDHSDDNTDCQTLRVSETNLNQSTEKNLNDEIILDNDEVDSVELQNQENNDAINEPDCLDNNNEGDSFTDSTDNVNNIVEQNDIVTANLDDTLVRKNLLADEPCSKEEKASDTLKTLDINPETKLINPFSLNNTLFSIKENIIKKLENLKHPKTSSRNANRFDQLTLGNLVANNVSSPIIYGKQDTDCQNEESIPITTVKPNICSDDLENVNEPSSKISMQDLQTISDSMLQQEEKDQESLMAMECSKPSKELTDSKIDISSRETEHKDLDESANFQNEVVIDSQNSDDFSNACPSDSAAPKQSFAQQIDGNGEASEVVVNRILQNDKGPRVSLNKVIQPEGDDLDLLRSPLPGLQDVLKLAPLPTLDNIKLRLTNLFDKNVRDVDESLSSEADSMTDITNILTPTMATDASTNNFLSKLPPLRLEDVNLDILQLQPPSGLLPKIPKIGLHSYRAKVPMPKDLIIKPVKLQSALENRGNVLGATFTLGRNKVWPNDVSRKITEVLNNPLETFSNLDKFKTRINTNTQKILSMPNNNPSLRSSVVSSQGLADLTDDLHSHAKNTWRSMQQTLESRFAEVTKIPGKLQSHDLLEAISQNHEDVNDKLRALHIDLNDRIESMRNDFIDKSRLVTSEFPRKANMKSFSAFNNRNSGKQLSLQNSQSRPRTSKKEPKKTFMSRKIEQRRKIGSASSTANQRKFKMPAVASVPVPKIVEVPQLKATSTKSPGLARPSGINPVMKNVEAQTNEAPVARWRQATTKLPISNTSLRKQINPFKDSKIKVSFSTTARPTIPSRTLKTTSTRLKDINSDKIRGGFGLKDANGSPSEITHSKILPSTPRQQNLHNLVNSGTDNESRQMGRSYDEIIPSRKLILTLPTLGNKEILRVDTQPRKSHLQSWPRVSEGAFLSKVKEAVETRMAKVDSSSKAKLSNEEKNSFTEIEPTFDIDMTRSASENTGVIEAQPLKENVSYKCKMVCNKE